MLDILPKLVRRPARLSSRGDPFERRKKPGDSPRPRVPHYSEFKQLRKNTRWNCISIILQTEVLVARVGAVDSKSVDSVLEDAIREFIFTVIRKDALNRISPGSRDMYEEPIVRYRNHISGISQMLESMSSRTIFGGCRLCTPSIHWPATGRANRQARRGSSVGQPLGFEASLAGRGSLTQCPTADHPTHRRIAAQPLGIVHVFVVCLAARAYCASESHPVS